MVMLDEPMAGVNPALTQSLLEHVKSLRDDGHDGDVRRARHGRRPRHLRLGHRDGRGPGHRRGHARPDQRQRRRDRRLPRRPPRRAAHRGRGGRRSWPRPRPPSRRSWSTTMADDAPLPPIEVDLEPVAEDDWDGPLLTAHDVVAGYVPGRRHPPRLRARAPEGRAGRHHRPQRRRQVHAAQGDVRARAGALRDRSTLRGEDITEAKAHRLVALGVGYVPQNNNVFPSLTVRENLEMGLYQRRKEFEPRFEEVCDAVPAARRAGASSGPARCRAASARWWPWAGRYDAPVGAAARRAVGRPVAGVPGRGVHPLPPDQRDRRVDRDGGAERPPLPADLPPRASCSTRAPTPTPAPATS